MAHCVNCGIEYEDCICDQCRNSVNLESLCKNIVEYKVGRGENQLWDHIASELSSYYNFRYVVFALADQLETPRKEYWKMLSLSGEAANVPKDCRSWLYEMYKEVKDDNNLTDMELNRIKGMVLGALFMDYRYEEADRIAGELLEQEVLPTQAYYNLADFYSKTRRYDEADEAIGNAGKVCGAEQIKILFGGLMEQNQKYREAETAGKRQYMPNPKVDKEKAQKAYIDYLASIGIEVNVPVTAKSKIPVPIPKDQYPVPKEIREPDFDTFVAYDLETTGLSTKIDAIIEIGAVKVSGGTIIESKEFTFQELVRPYKKTIPDDVIALTGITREDAKDAREMWEVFPDFMKFIGDSVLVGFNNIRFDSKFLVRAGRYSHLEMNNPQFDIARYAEKFRDQLGIDSKGISLEVLSDKLEINNPEAHRALADAITTAKVFLKLKEMDISNSPESIDDLISDIDSWL